VQAILTRVLADDETGGTPAFETHGPAAVGPASVPGDVIKFAFSADDGFAWLHGSGFTSAFKVHRSGDTFLFSPRIGIMASGFFLVNACQ